MLTLYSATNCNIVVFMTVYIYIYIYTTALYINVFLYWRLNLMSARQEIMIWLLNRRNRVAKASANLHSLNWFLLLHLYRVHGWIEMSYMKLKLFIVSVLWQYRLRLSSKENVFRLWAFPYCAMIFIWNAGPNNKHFSLHKTRSSLTHKKETLS